MNAPKKLIASLLLAMFSTSAFAITDNQVFAYAEANYPSLFTGTATAGQYLQYNYRYYPASGNYLAVDTSGMISILGPYTGDVVTPVGLVTAFAPTITAWETTQGGTAPVAAAGTLMGGAVQGIPLTFAGTVTAFAGSGTWGALDGVGTAASFNAPERIASDGANLYVTDYGNNTIRKIVIATGAVSTLAGSTGVFGAVDGTGQTASFGRPYGITTDGTNLYVTDYVNGSIRKIVIASGVVTTFARGFVRPSGITTDGTNLYVGDLYNQTISKVVIATGAVSTLAGTVGVTGSTDGTGAAASFNSPKGITTDGTNLYVVDRLNHKIRKIVIATGVVSTLATLDNPWAITTDGTNLYVADVQNIRKIVISTGVVSTLPGSFPPGMILSGITSDGANLYVLEGMGGTISKIQ